MCDRGTSRENWTRVRFGEVVRLVRDRVDPATSGLHRYVAGEHMDSDDLRIRRWGRIGDGYLGPAFHMRFKPGHVLYGSRRTYLRKVAIADFEGICANTTLVLESADPSVLLPELLPFVMQAEAFHNHSIKQSKGSVNPYVNFSDLEWYEFDLPPIEEQERQATVLKATAQGIDCFQEALRAAELLDTLLVDKWVLRNLAPGVESKAGAGRVAVGDLFSPVVDRGHDRLPILAVTVDGLIVTRESLGRHVSDNTGPEKCLRVESEDLAYNTMRLWQGAIGVANETGLLSPAYTVMRPRAALPVSRLWVKVFRSAPLRHEYRKLVRGIAKDRWRIYFSDLATITFARKGIGAMHELETLLADATASVDAIASRTSQIKTIHNQLAATLA